MVATFTAVGLLVSGAGSVVDVAADAVRYFAAALMGLLGAILLSTALQQRLAFASAPVADFLTGPCSTSVPLDLVVNSLWARFSVQCGVRAPVQL